jgi:hypothetical protein
MCFSLIKSRGWNNAINNIDVGVYFHHARGIMMHALNARLKFPNILGNINFKRDPRWWQHNKLPN